MKKILLFVVVMLLLFAAYVLGFRFHPEALQRRLFETDQRQFRKIDLRSGKTFVGEVLKETPDSVKVTFEGGAMSFSKKEIMAMEPVDPKTSKFSEYADEMVMLSQKPIFTFQREDSLFYEAPPLVAPWVASIKSGHAIKSGSPPAARPASAQNPLGEESQAGLPQGFERALELAQKTQEMAEQRRAEQEELVRQMEEGR